MYRLTSAHQQILATISELADRDIAPHAAGVDRDSTFVGDSIAALARHGFLGLTVPAELGGMGQGPVIAAAAVEAVAQRCASTAMVFLMHLCGIACYAAAGDKMRGPLRNAAAGAHLATLAFSEPGSRSHFWAPVSQAADSGEHVRLTARKSFVTSAGHAEAMSRRLLKFSGGSVDDYATFSTSTASPSC